MSWPKLIYFENFCLKLNFKHLLTSPLSISHTAKIVSWTIIYPELNDVVNMSRAREREKIWAPWQELNLWPSTHRSDALTTELGRMRGELSGPALHRASNLSSFFIYQSTMSSLQKQYKKLAGFSIALKIEVVNTSFLAAKAVKLKSQCPNMHLVTW